MKHQPLSRQIIVLLNFINISKINWTLLEYVSNTYKQECVSDKNLTISSSPDIHIQTEVSCASISPSTFHGNRFGEGISREMLKALKTLVMNS